MIYTYTYTLDCRIEFYAFSLFFKGTLAMEIEYPITISCSQSAISYGVDKEHYLLEDRVLIYLNRLLNLVNKLIIPA